MHRTLSSPAACMCPERGASDCRWQGLAGGGSTAGAANAWLARPLCGPLEPAHLVLLSYIPLNSPNELPQDNLTFLYRQLIYWLSCAAAPTRAAAGRQVSLCVFHSYLYILDRSLK